MESLHGGTLLGARGTGFVMFWDWESGEIVRRIDVEAKNVSYFLSLFNPILPFFGLGFLVRYQFVSRNYTAAS
jgi:Coatomer WD associated region